MNILMLGKEFQKTEMRDQRHVVNSRQWIQRKMKALRPHSLDTIFQFAEENTRWNQTSRHSLTAARTKQETWKKQPHLHSLALFSELIKVISSRRKVFLQKRIKNRARTASENQEATGGLLVKIFNFVAPCTWILQVVLWRWIVALYMFSCAGMLKPYLVSWIYLETGSEERKISDGSKSKKRILPRRRTKE